MHPRHHLDVQQKLAADLQLAGFKQQVYFRRISSSLASKAFSPIPLGV